MRKYKWVILVDGLFFSFTVIPLRGFLSCWMQWSNDFLMLQGNSSKVNKCNWVKKTNSRNKQSFFQSQNISLSLQGGVFNGARGRGWDWSSGRHWGETDPAGLTVQLASRNINKWRRRPDSFMSPLWPMSISGHSRSPPYSTPTLVPQLHMTHDSCAPHSRPSGRLHWNLKGRKSLFSFGGDSVSEDGETGLYSHREVPSCPRRRGQADTLCPVSGKSSAWN